MCCAPVTGISTTRWCEALYKLSKEVDCIAFAQISMSLLKHEPVDVPLFKIGASGFEKIKELMNCK